MRCNFPHHMVGQFQERDLAPLKDDARAKQPLNEVVGEQSVVDPPPLVRLLSFAGGCEHEAPLTRDLVEHMLDGARTSATDIFTPRLPQHLREMPADETAVEHHDEQS